MTVREQPMQISRRRISIRVAARASGANVVTVRSPKR